MSLRQTKRLIINSGTLSLSIIHLSVSSNFIPKDHQVCRIKRGTVRNNIGAFLQWESRRRAKKKREKKKRKSKKKKKKKKKERERKKTYFGTVERTPDRC